MKGTPAIYKGRVIDKKVFRAFVYGSDGQRKLVESWEAYEAAMQSGIWFSSKKDAEAIKEIAAESEENVQEEKPKPKPKPAPKPSNKKVKEPPQKADPIEDDEMGFEVTDENK